jgi:HPt (histidine-containing phosphotransfer) domain-containing protein
MGMEFDWERLKRALNRMYRDNDDVQQSVGEFLERMPSSLEEVYEKIPEARVEAYRQRAVAATVAQIREFVPA